MNIHITNEDTLYELKRNTIASAVIGSKMYGTDIDISDTDILHIFIDKNVTFVNSHHQLQYKSKFSDEMFTSLKQFLYNLINGDSTINFEFLFNNTIKYTDLYLLRDFIEEFQGYNLIKAYLGMVRKDIKAYKKNMKNYKKLYHIERGLLTAKKIINDELKGIVVSLYTTKEVEFLKEVRNGLHIKDIEVLEKTMLSLREDALAKFERGEIHKTMCPFALERLENVYKGLVSNEKYFPIYFGDIYRDVWEKGVQYEK